MINYVLIDLTYFLHRAASLLRPVPQPIPRDSRTDRSVGDASGKSTKITTPSRAAPGQASARRARRRQWQPAASRGCREKSGVKTSQGLRRR
ncbi:hypothetical protein CBM2599_A120028 [Cupriavidus taiwanensis]|uniref:Uncharacterized protein n=1 Tax=Cupriavidus taiwanensis TaxID=164546 RepID=A0A976FU99_9BURK|nr:hypothetical protein CBM2599_A120028 [Cupriavidus taiwanensis]SOY81436.1 hypothetical protein CBM2600_A120054 [Cupriavidus taiwanensis]SPD64670.1 protein of unknown function [Cupriavidus taiwanensis]